MAKILFVEQEKQEGSGVNLSTLASISVIQMKRY